MPTGLKVLCVEDDHGILETLVDLLTLEGYEVTPAASTDEATGHLNHEHFHLIVSDYNLPDGKGTDVIEFARSRDLLSATAALIISANPDVPSLGPIPFMKKPLDVDRFVRRVEELLASAREKEVIRAYEDLAKRARAYSEKFASLQPSESRSSGVELILYTSDASPASLKAVRNLQRILNEFEPAGLDLKIIDLSTEFPPCAHEDRIAFTPTLVKRAPGVKAWVLGSMDDPQQVRDLLLSAHAELKEGQ